MHCKCLKQCYALYPSHYLKAGKLRFHPSYNSCIYNQTTTVVATDGGNWLTCSSCPGAKLRTHGAGAAGCSLGTWSGETTSSSNLGTRSGNTTSSNSRSGEHNLKSHGKLFIQFHQRPSYLLETTSPRQSA